MEISSLLGAVANEGVLLVSQGIFFMLGRAFFRRALFKDVEIKSASIEASIQLHFSIVFMLSLTLLELIILEITNLFNPVYGAFVHRSNATERERDA